MPFSSFLSLFISPAMFLALAVLLFPAGSASADPKPGPDYFAGGVMHIISSSHQDIAWMDSPANCIEGRDRKVITPALELLRRNPDFRFSMEDALVLMEYLERHPESREEIAALTRAGRFEWGATYNQPYESLHTGEALVRQTYLGRRWLQKTLPGCDTHVAWNVDVPGRAMQMPQILAKAGIDYLYMSRHEKGIYRWMSPDGSSVLAFSPGHYFTSGEPLRLAEERGADHTTIIQRQKDFKNVEKGLTERLSQEAAYFQPRGIPPQTGLLMSTDFAGPADLSDIIRQWNAKAGKRKPLLQYSTGEEFLKAVSSRDARFDTIQGERPDVWLYIHGPAHHRAISAGRDAERLLPAAETFAAIENTLPGAARPYPSDTLERAWADALYPDHGWGGFNGKITDRVFRNRMEAGRDTAQAILDRSQRAIAARVGVKTGCIPLVVFNSLSWTRTDPVSVNLTVEGMENTRFRLVDALGQEVPYQIQTGENHVSGNDESVSILFIAREVPPVGYKTYYLLPGTDNNPRPTSPRPAKDTGFMENAFYRIEFAPGGIRSIMDRELNREVLRTDRFLGAEFFSVQSVGNGAGEFAEVQKVTLDGFEKLSMHRPAWTCVEDGPVRTTYEISQTMNHCTVRLRIGLYRDIKRIDCATDIIGFDGDNSREFRLAFPLDLKRAEVAYDAPMGVVEVGKSEIKGAAGERYVQPCAEVHPREVQDWFDASDNGMGVTISSSVAVFDWIDPTVGQADYPVLQPILLASRRSCHGEGNWYLQAGDHSYRFSLFTHPGGWKNGYRPGAQAARPLTVVAGEPPSKTPSLPETMSFCRISPENLVLSVIKKCEDDPGIVVRFYDIEGKDTEGVVEWFSPPEKAERTDLLERQGKAIPMEGSRLRVQTGHHSIETVKLFPKVGEVGATGYLPLTPPEFSPAGGVYLESPLEVRLTASTPDAEIRYTLDGSEPAPGSLKYSGPLSLDGTVTVRARAYRPGITASGESSAKYQAGPLRSSVAETKPGLEYSAYEGSWDHLPDFDRLTPVKTGRAKHFGLEVKPREHAYGLRFSGYISVPADGVYTFSTVSDDGSRMWVDGQIVADNDGQHTKTEVKSSIALQKGKHRIQLIYFESQGEYGLEAWFEGPDVKKQRIPESLLSH